MLGKKKTHTKHFQLKSINDLDMCVFIVKRKFEGDLRTLIEEYDGRILSVVPASGISHSSMFEAISSISEPCSVAFCTARSEDSKKLIYKVSEELELYKPNNGKAFKIDITGYLGAKALFL